MRRVNRSIFHKARWLLAEERGTAAIEFIVAGVLLLVPLFYLILALASVQAQSMGAESAARSIARALAVNPEGASAEAIANVIAEQYGIDPGTLSVTLSCAPTGAACPSPGAMLTVTVTASAKLPLIPSAFDLDQATSLPIIASAVQKVAAQ